MRAVVTPESSRSLRLAGGHSCPGRHERLHHGDGLAGDVTGRDRVLPGVEPGRRQVLGAVKRSKEKDRHNP